MRRDSGFAVDAKRAGPVVQQGIVRSPEHLPFPQSRTWLWEEISRQLSQILIHERLCLAQRSQRHRGDLNLDYRQTGPLALT